MRITRVASYIIYVVAFSLVCSLASQIEMALTAWSWGFSSKSLYSIFELIGQFPGHMFFAILQIIAAVLTVRKLALKRLFCLSCVFTVVSVLLCALEHQVMKSHGSLFFPLFLTGQLLPYVAPVIILALVGRKKSVLEPPMNVGTDAIPVSAESEAASAPKTKGKIRLLYGRYWYVFDILLILIAFLYATLNDPFGLIIYVCGLYNQLVFRAMLTFMWVFGLVPAAFCFVVLVLRMILSWPKHIKNKHRLLLLRLLVIVGLGAYSILPFTLLIPPGMSTYMKGFRHYIEAKADVVGIRSWLGTLGPEDCVVYNITLSGGRKASSPKNLQEQEWPKVVAQLKPRYVTLSVDDDKQPKVRLNWGSGFLGSWGLVVGNEAMPTPESDLSLHGEYREEISKGAYIWYGID